MSNQNVEMSGPIPDDITGWILKTRIITKNTILDIDCNLWATLNHSVIKDQRLGSSKSTLLVGSAGALYRRTPPVSTCQCCRPNISQGCQFNGSASGSQDMPDLDESD
ncbi:hypothetical protein EYF80_010270 [Liparis tanakae]|uniref:Uncharacterized protein n=1 Tax=Liparis tanakae TaxID=230148 RepID=A0A4Z2INJ8_9TELE|nr:hypothetical protein EYF80_010270 [Liparis tanakae]